MATTETTPSQRDESRGYELVGTLLEACECGVLCPCWIGEDPDEGKCDSFNAYHFDAGHIHGVDVSGLNLIKVARIPGNVLKGKTWVCVYLVDDRATPEQKELMLDAFNGKLGGSLTDLAGLIGDVLAVYDVPIKHDVVEGKGTLSVPGILESRMEPFKSADGITTTLHDTVFSTIPGAPAWVSRAAHHKMNLPDHDMVWEFEGRNAIQGEFKITG